MAIDDELTLEALVRDGRNLGSRSDNPTYTHQDFEDWVNQVANWLDKQYPSSGRSAEWSALPGSSLVVARRYDDSRNAWIAFQIAVRRRLQWLGKIGAASAPVRIDDNSKHFSTRVFVVHGHNDALRDATARFLEKLKLEPIILHEQPNRGRTIIEKFTECDDVGFAVVLLTGDDQGGMRDAKRTTNKLRTRQNVILELGYFLGRLGRERVCAIYESGVELPSDYEGVLWIEYDTAGAWKLKLAKEIRAVGLVVDMNDAI